MYKKLALVLRKVVQGLTVYFVYKTNILVLFNVKLSLLVLFL